MSQEAALGQDAELGQVADAPQAIEAVTALLMARLGKLLGKASAKLEATVDWPTHASGERGR